MLPFLVHLDYIWVFECKLNFACPCSAVALCYSCCLGAFSLRADLGVSGPAACLFPLFSIVLRLCFPFLGRSPLPRCNSSCHIRTNSHVKSRILAQFKKQGSQKHDHFFCQRVPPQIYPMQALLQAPDININLAGYKGHAQLSRSFCIARVKKVCGCLLSTYPVKRIIPLSTY